MEGIKRALNLLLMELGYQYERLNKIIWREDFKLHPSLRRKKIEKMIKKAKRDGREWIICRSTIDEVKLSLRERWQAWSEDGATLITKYDTLERKFEQWWNEHWEEFYDDTSPKLK